MSNPIFNALGGNMMPGNNMLAQFQQFRKQMQGKNPHEEINRLYKVVLSVSKNLIKRNRWRNNFNHYLATTGPERFKQIY